MIESIKNKAYNVRKKIISDNNLDLIKKQEFLKKLDNLDIVFKDEKCFLHMDFETAISVLAFLEIPEEEILEVYNSLITLNALNKEQQYNLYDISDTDIELKM